MHVEYIPAKHHMMPLRQRGLGQRDLAAELGPTFWILITHMFDALLREPESLKDLPMSV